MKENFLLILLLCSLSTVAQTTSDNIQISDSVRISLVTGAPGSDLYSQFGHSAIRVIDYKNRRDWSFNYGTFDFDAPNFYLNFMKGKLNYTLSLSETKNMILVYEYYGRKLIDQEIILSKEEKKAVIDFLIYNYRPENRGYLYDFFYDNCATRIRDIFEKEVQGFTYEEGAIQSYTFRQMLDIYTGANSWVNFGFDLILGYPTDKVTDMREQMFLPDYLAENLTKFARNDGLPLLKAPIPLNRAETEVNKSSFISPMLVTILIGLLAILVTFLGKVKAAKWFDSIFFSLLGMMGLLMLFMWFGTDHWTTTKNLNVLWANPLFLLLPFLKNLKYIYLLGLVGVAIVLIGWQLLPQQFHIAFLPILFAIALRCIDKLDWLPFKK